MKNILKIMVTISLVCFIAVLTQAQTQTPTKQSTTSSTNTKFVDANKNGICDNYEIRGKSGQGKNFTDKNGDGVCDNKGTTVNCPGKGTCMGCGNGAGKGNCCGNGPHNGCNKGHQHRHGGNCPNTTTPPVTK